MNRVYDIRPNTEAGERSTRGIRVFTRAGEIQHVRRVEFDADTAVGVARITTLVHDGFCYVVDPSLMGLAEVQFKAMVRVVEPIETGLNPVATRLGEIQDRLGQLAANLAGISMQPETMADAKSITEELKQLFTERDGILGVKVQPATDSPAA